MGRHILRDRTSFCPIFSSGIQGVPTLAPPCKLSRADACPSLDSRFSALFKTDRVVITYRYVYIAIQANTPNQAETLLHSLERAAAGIGLYVSAHKTEHMCFNQAGDISTLEGTSLKLVDKFTYLGSSVSSTEKDSYR